VRVGGEEGRKRAHRSWSEKDEEGWDKVIGQKREWMNSRYI